MSEANANAFLETEKLGTLMRKYSVHCVISLLVAALYNIVDQIFIANASYLGSYGNAANTVVFPLTVVALAVAVMIGDGCCAYVSICLGSRNRENAHRSIGSAVTLCVAASLVLTLLYLLLADPILTAFGGRVSQETFALSREYFFYITLGIPFYMFGQAMNPIIRSDGSPAFAMASTLASRFSDGLTSQDRLWVLQRELILELAEKGPCVIVGRCADFILREKADCLTAFIHADMAFRAKRIVEVYGQRQDSPEKRLQDKDRRRAAYYQFYTDTRWGQARNYHIALDSGVLGIDRCAELLAELYESCGQVC